MCANFHLVLKLQHSGPQIGPMLLMLHISLGLVKKCHPVWILDAPNFHGADLGT